MTELYTGEELLRERALKKKMLIIWLIIFGIYLLISAAILTAFCLLPYGTLKTPFIVSDIAISTIFWGLTLYFYSTKYYRLKKYVKMLEYLNIGIKENHLGQFTRYDDVIDVKDGVEFYKMILKEWNERKQEYYDRKVLIDNEIIKPAFNKGDRLKYVTQGNILLKYKIFGNGENNK
ncbi:MAG: hypothetical protein PHE12_03230 [Clostridia bacterium]|nr:hypothetical protein [Clostridia bacterium]